MRQTIECNMIQFRQDITQMIQQMHTIYASLNSLADQVEADLYEEAAQNDTIDCIELAMFGVSEATESLNDARNHMQKISFAN